MSQRLNIEHSVDSPIKLIKTYASFIKFAHTIFALPFALVGMLAAYAVPTEFVFDVSNGGFARHVPFLFTMLALIVLCMVGARSFAMGVNRILDRKIDALNPRTAKREIPSGKLSLPKAWGFAIGMAILYFGACWMLGSVVLWLSPVPILLMLVYPSTKQFTAACHVVLGASLGLAPVGAWVAVRSTVVASFGKPEAAYWYLAESLGEGSVRLSTIGWSAVTEPLPWLLGGAVMFWVAGFDVIYALQDDEFDREHKLHSIPAKFGRKGALWISRGMHVLSAGLFVAFTWLLLNPAPVAGMDVRQYTSVGEWVWIAPALMIAGMIYQHALVQPNDLTRVNMAFFTVNGVLSVAFSVVFLMAFAWLRPA